MRALVRKSAELLRKHPILWLPYICANLCASGLSRLRSMGMKEIFYWLAVKRWHPAPAGTSTSSIFDAAVRNVERLNSVLVWGLTYVEFSIDSTAMVLTALLVGLALCNERPALWAALKGLRGYPARILLYALKFWFLYLALDVVLLEAGSLFRPLAYLNDPGGSPLTTGVDSAAAIFFAWLMAPIAIRLLRRAGAPAPSKAQKRLGRYCFMLTVAVSLILGRVLDPIFLKYIAGSIAPAVSLALASLLAQFPFVLLYIALALLANKAPLEPGMRKASGLRAVSPT